MRIPKKLKLVSGLIFLSGVSIGQSIVVKPYLQNAEPTSIKIMWETSSGTESTVQYGTSNALGSTENGGAENGKGSSQIHTTEISNLQPNTKYYYRAKTGNYQSSIHEFVTPPTSQSEEGFGMIAFSDMQSHPTEYGKIVNDGIIKYSRDNMTGDLSMDLGMVIIPGDLVGQGYEYGQWEDHFFNPAEDLYSDVPVYPVIGNHDRNDYNSDPNLTEAQRIVNYKKYFDLPKNGSAPSNYEEWWYKDYSNVRIIGLNSVFNANQTQLNWLQQVLNDTKSLDHIDFVFCQMHHPHKSELWTPGEKGFSADVVEMLETFSTQSDKPSIQFFGHTHGYSRGQSRDHGLVMLNVGSGGGALDNWGDFPQEDYDEFSVSHDEFGFVLVNVTAGDYPRFELKKMGMGKEGAMTAYTVRDEMMVKKVNDKPATPSAISPVGTSNETTLKATPFSDPDNDGMGGAHFQLSSNANFTNLLLDDWKQHENWYYMANTQAGDDLTDLPAAGLVLGNTYYWRVRYRDKALAWSDWSSPATFIYSTQTSNEPVANFTANTTVISEGESVTFTDVSANNPTSRTWTFEGGTPGTSTEANPTVKYASAGTYKVTLEVANQYGTDTKTVESYIVVLKPGVGGDTIAYYPFSDNTYDLSGNDRHGNPTGVSYETDPIRGRVGSFNGSAYADVQTGVNASAGMPVKDITVATWVKVDNVDGWGGFVGLFQDNGAEEFGWVLGTVDQKFSIAMTTVGNPMTYLQDDEDFTVGQWYHVAATYNGSQLNLYVDGELKATSTAQSGNISYPTSGWLSIGRYKDNNEDDGHTGELDDVLILKAALTEQEIADIAKGIVSSVKHFDENGKIIQLLAPNPTEGNVRVGAALQGKLTIEIFSSASGQKVYSSVNQAGDFVDVSNLSKGMYIMRVTNKRRIYTEKMIKK